MKLTCIVKIKGVATLGKVLRKDWRSVQGVNSVLSGYRLRRYVSFMRISHAAHLRYVHFSVYYTQRNSKKRKLPTNLKDRIY